MQQDDIAKTTLNVWKILPRRTCGPRSSQIQPLDLWMRAYIQSAKDNEKNIGKNYLIYLLEFKRNIRAIGLCMPMDVIFGGRMLILIG